VAIPETLGVILAVGLTIGVLSAPFKENVYWKICEYAYLGVGAGYWLVLALDALQSNLVIPLSKGNIIYIVPLVISLLFYAGFVNKVAWLNRYPVAIAIGVGTAVTMRTVIETSFISQIAQTFNLNLLAASGAAVQGNPKIAYVNNIAVLISIIATVLFFAFWELKPKRVFAGIRTIGLNIIMITFACEMAISIITRVTRLAGRFFFILEPDNQLYTIIFTLAAIVAVAMVQRSEIRDQKQPKK
jgi:hypothetical protein